MSNIEVIRELYKRGKCLKILIAIFITAGITSACAPKNSDQTMLANGMGRESAVSGAAMPNQTTTDSIISELDAQLLEDPSRSASASTKNDETVNNLLGEYVIQGELYIYVVTYYIQDSILYVEGYLYDGIFNPDGEDDGDRMDFFSVNGNYVKIKIDNETTIPDDMDIYQLKKHLDNIIYCFNQTYIAIKLDGDYVKEYLDNWTSS